VPRGIVATALNQSSITEKKSRFSIGIDERQDYSEKKHGSRARIHVNIDEDEGNEIVDSIYWLLKKVCFATADSFPAGKSI